jgi:homoserine kinase
MSGALKLRLPATSANLGPGFDASAIALDFHLEIEARPAGEFSINATGRNADRCAKIEKNLILEIYKGLLQAIGKPIVPLAIEMNNGIPLGMGCGSSAAGRLAGIALAVHFGGLAWNGDRILEEACFLEGHPDNAAACWLGGFVTAAAENRTIHLAKVIPPVDWRAIIVLPATPLATVKARAVLPNSYSRADAVTNIQSAALLGLAFAQARPELLQIAMRDRIHQPYRAAICPLLPRLLPLAGKHGIAGIALSGAGPAVLAVVAREADLAAASTAIREALTGEEETELLVSSFLSDGAEQGIERLAL